MWSLFPTNLLISQNVLGWSDYALETYSNAELVAVNQDVLGSPAQRIVGDDLTFPCTGGGAMPNGAAAAVMAAPCNPTDPAQQWTYDAATGYITAKQVPNAVLDDFGCGSKNNNPVALFKPDRPDPKHVGTGGAGDTDVAGKGAPINCGGKNQHWAHNGNGTITNQYNGMCLDVFEYQGTVRVFSKEGSTRGCHCVSLFCSACSEHDHACATDAIPLGCPPPLTGTTVNDVATLKALW
jgi:hypothetical protein